MHTSSIGMQPCAELRASLLTLCAMYYGAGTGLFLHRDARFSPG
jgi:hypothetical protein